MPTLLASLTSEGGESFSEAAMAVVPVDFAKLRAKLDLFTRMRAEDPNLLEVRASWPLDLAVDDTIGGDESLLVDEEPETDEDGTVGAEESWITIAWSPTNQEAMFWFGAAPADDDGILRTSETFLASELSEWEKGTT